METNLVGLSQIRIDGGTQQRVSIAEDAVREYAEKMKFGEVFPPVTLFFDGADYWLGDGFHRFHAARLAERDTIIADVRTGTQREAVLFAACANQAHGLKRTNADKRKAVLTLISDDEWRRWTDAEVARRCGVGRELVASIRSHVESTSEKSAPRTYITKHGTESTMKVGSIGRNGGTLKSRELVVARRDQIRTMATEGHTVQQIAASVGLNERTVSQFVNDEKIDVPASRALGRSRRHDSNRIVEQMVMDAENLTADVNLIVFADLDAERLGMWIDTLNQSKTSLNAFIRQLVKEHQKHVEAA